MEERGNVKPFPPGPPPCVCPVYTIEVEALADDMKLEAVVEKHMKASERWSFPA